MNLKPQTKTLSNGMRLVTLSLPQMRSVTALLMIKVGSRYEAEDKAGISHFLEHLPAKGTKKYPTAQDLAVTIDSVGAEHNAFTSKEYTGFYVKSASNHLELALDVLSQLVFHPLLPEKDIEREKGVIIEEINMYNDHPMARVGSEFEELIFPDSSLGRRVIGFKKTIKARQRKDFVNYRQQWYQPRRMVLGIVGGINRTNGQIKKYFNQKNRDQEDKKKDDLKSLTFIQQKPSIKLRYKKTEQTHLCLGVRSFPHGHKDRYVMAVLTTILGGNMSSRLFTEVRERRGLAYYIKSDISTYFDNGYLVSQAGVDIRKVEEAIKVILEVYKSISKKVNKRELKKAKEYLKGKMALGLEDSKTIVSLFVEDLLLGDEIRTPKEIITEVEKVSLGDIKRVAKKIFVNQGLNLALIGPYKDKSRFEKILKI